MSIDTFLLSSDTTDLNYPEVRPTLDLNFARVKALDPRITFTRASGGSYVGADGLIKLAGVNEPRFDHDPVTGESLGFLVEEARTNRHTYSEQFDNAAWGKNGATITSNATTAPDGTTTADKFASTSGAAIIALQQADYTLTNGASYTRTVFAKASEISSITIQVGNTSTGTVVVQANLSTGTATNGGVVTTLANGWFRISYSYTQDSGTVGDFYLTLPANTVAGSGVFIWGAQLEAGSFPTSYIPTTSATVTRAADVASITGKNFSSWYNKNQGTVLCDYRTLQSYGWAVVWQLLTGGNQGFLGMQYDYYFASFSRQGGGLVALLGASFTNNLNKTIISYSSVSSTSVSSTSVTINGAAPVSGSQIVLDTIDSLSFYGPPDPHLTKTIARFTYYPKRLTDAQLQVLTR